MPHHFVLKTIKVIAAIEIFFFSLAGTASPQANAEAKITASFSTTEQVSRIRLTPPQGVKLNYDGPWKLEIAGPMASKGKVKSPQTKEDFNKESQQFFFTSAQKISAQEAESSQWKLVYFLCNTENTWCKRLSAVGNFTVHRE